MKTVAVLENLTFRQHRIYVAQKLLDPITNEDRTELLAMVTAIVSRLAVRFQGDA